MEEMNVVMPKFESEAEVYDWVMSQMVPGAEGDELSEEALDMVAGGMSDAQAWKIMSTAYWDLCICGKKKTKYSDKKIFEAMKICDKHVNKFGNGCKKILDWFFKNADKIFG